MKDGYSSHLAGGLGGHYERVHRAYERIFKRAGCKNVVSVLSDSGMMGGSISHEFMLLTDIGEDTLALCSECDFKANLEAAPCIVDNVGAEAIEPLEEVYTPHMQTITDVADFLHVEQTRTCKAVVYQQNADDRYVIVFIAAIWRSTTNQAA